MAAGLHQRVHRQRPVASITAQVLLIMLRQMESKGRYETAKRDVATDLRGALTAPKPRDCMDPKPAPLQKPAVV